MGGRRGGGMLRTVGRAMGVGVGGVQEALTTTTRPTNKPASISSNLLSLSSNSCSTTSVSSSLPVATTSTASPTWYSSDEWEWESVDGGEAEGTNGFYDKFVFGSVPSKDEVEDAVSALQQVLAPASFPQLVVERFSSSADNDATNQIASPTGLMHRVSSTGSELDWIEPALHLYNPKMLRSRGSERVYDAFHLLQTNSSIQRVVVSLSTDKAVWDAVLNNEVVRELRDTFYSVYADENDRPWSSEESPDAAKSILRWILDNTKEKSKELIEKITKLVNEVFKPPQMEKTATAATDMFNNTLRSSLMISIVVLLIVVMNRAHRT